MEWIQKYSSRPLPKDNSLAHKFKNLTIEENLLNQPTEKALPLRDRQPQQQNFDDLLFKSSLKNSLRQHSIFCHIETSSEEGVFMEISLLLESQFQQWNVSATVQINLHLQYIRYKSFPLRSNQLLSFTQDQIKTIARYLSFNFNPKHPLGCMSIDIETGELLHQVINNSLGHMQRRIRKAPNELILSIEGDIIQIGKAWLTFLSRFLHLMSIPTVRNPAHPFWLTYKEANIYECINFNQLTEYINQSYIEYPFMFEQQTEVNGQPKISKIRSKFLSSQAKKRKKEIFKEMRKNRHGCSLKFTKDIANILREYTSPALINYDKQRNTRDLSEEQIQQFSEQLISIESSQVIYSKLAIQDILKENLLYQAGLSRLSVLTVQAKKIEDAEFRTFNIVSKATDNRRCINETEILKVIGNGKSKFIARFYFPMEHMNQFTDKILLEHYPHKSINQFLQNHGRFISFETRLYFLYQIGFGIRFLRDYGIVHNDLKPLNVLLNIMRNNIGQSYFFLRIIDFGESQSAFQSQRSRNNLYRRGFTIPYTSYEYFSEKYKITEKSDIFSLGVIIYEVVLSQLSVQAIRQGKTIYMTEENYLKLFSIPPEKFKYFSFPKLAQLLYFLCLRCLDPQPQRRPTIDWVVIILRELMQFADKAQRYY